MSINSKITEQEIGIEFKVSKLKLWRQGFIRFCRNKPFGAAGGLIVLAVVLMIVASLAFLLCPAMLESTLERRRLKPEALGDSSEIWSSDDGFS